MFADAQNQKTVSSHISSAVLKVKFQSVYTQNNAEPNCRLAQVCQSGLKASSLIFLALASQSCGSTR